MPMTKEKFAIEIEKIFLNYSEGAEKIAALSQIDLTIASGEFVCVMGPSGCGKSTLLNILAGFLTPTTGTVRIDGKEITGIDAGRGVVFQHPPLYEWYSVKKNVGFGLKMQKKSKIESKKIVDYYLDEIGLTEFADKKVYELSGGMQQRASIASALVINPQILLMDEPFGALDALTREQMQALIRGIWSNTKKTIFFITHDIDEALLLGTRVIVMSKHPGQIVADFPAQFTQKFLVNAAENIQYTEEFHKQRDRILTLINNQ